MSIMNIFKKEEFKQNNFKEIKNLTEESKEKDFPKIEKEEVKNIENNSKESSNDLLNIVSELKNNASNTKQEISELESHQKNILDRLENIENQMTKFLSLYEVVSNKYNPFIEDEKNPDDKIKNILDKKDDLFEEEISNEKPKKDLIKNLIKTEIPQKEILHKELKEEKSKDDSPSFIDLDTLNSKDKISGIPLIKLNSDTNSLVLVLNWLKYLVGIGGHEGCRQALKYYAEILKWITPEVYFDLDKLLEGLETVNVEKIKKLQVKDHIVSLYFIAKLNSGSLDKKLTQVVLDIIEHEHK